MSSVTDARRVRIESRGAIDKLSVARGRDIAFADRLDAALKARGFETLIDRSDIYAFEEWWKRVAVPELACPGAARN
jgi:hypothetical protein